MADKRDAQDRRPRKMCDIRFELGERNRAAFLTAIRAGATTVEACAAAGWTNTATYRQNRRRYRTWAARVDYERSLAVTGDRPWSPSRYGGPDSKWPFLRGLNL